MKGSLERLLVMVNEKRVKDKIPELLSEGSLSVPENLYKYQSTREKLRRIEKKNPFVLNQIVKSIKRELEAIDELLSVEV